MSRQADIKKPAKPGREVLLKAAVEAFKDVVTGAGEGHVAVAGKEVYQQPPVYLTMHVVEMRAAGWKQADYDTLAAVSGTSALFGYLPTDFGPKYAGMLVGPDERIAAATGFGYEWVNFANAEEAWAIIKASLDAGKAVKGMHYENCAFVGYRDAAKPAGRRLYVIGDGPGTFSKWWTWKEFNDWVRMVQSWRQCRLGRHTKRVRRKAAKAVALRVMNDLVAWSRTPPPACPKRWRKAVWGLAGIEAYAADVADPAKKPKEHFKDTAWCACHGVNGQWTARNSSAVYLEGVATSGTFPKKVNDRLLAAAKQYRAAFAAWKVFYERLGHKAPKNAWLDKARRKAGGDAAGKWAACEKAAVAEVAAALKALDVDVEYPPEVDVATLPPPGPSYPGLAGAKKIKAPDGSGKAVEWAVLAGEWSVKGGKITGAAGGNGYLCRVKEHADDLRVTATLRAVEGDEVTVWICGSPERTEREGYTLAVSADGCKLQRQGDDARRLGEPKIEPGKDVVLTFERKGATLRGFLGKARKPFIEWADPQPIRGEGHRTLGFYVWSGRVAVSKVKVQDLPPQPVQAAPAPAGAGKELAGLKPEPMWMTHMGCLVGSAKHLKLDASRAWIVGGCGHAFALNVHEKLCPSGPTAWCHEKCDDLAAHVGLKVERHVTFKDAPDTAARQREIFAAVRRATGAGRPCFAWWLDHGEWYLLRGYDGDGNYVFGRLGGTGIGRKHHTRLVENSTGVGLVAIVSPARPADDRKTVREALRFALAHGAGRHSHEVWGTGLAGYDAWIKAMRGSWAVEDNDACGHGFAYNAACWAESRRDAVAFLAEARRRLDDARLKPHFDEALRHYRAVAGHLDALAKTFPFDLRDAQGMIARARDAACRGKAEKALTAARKAEAAGLKALARIAAALGAKDVDPDKAHAPTPPAGKGR